MLPYFVGIKIINENKAILTFFSVYKNIASAIYPFLDTKRAG
jgi:hypothetical protein